MKLFTVEFDKRAEAELDEAFEYYLAINLKLATRFYQEALVASQTLSVNPYFQVRYNNVRCLLVKGFPYMLHYIIDEANALIKIEAVIHCSANPETKWLVNEP